jgi:hypothetical protein
MRLSTRSFHHLVATAVLLHTGRIHKNSKDAAGQQWLEREASTSLVFRWSLSSFHHLSSPALSQALCPINEHGREIRALVIANRPTVQPTRICAFARDFPCGKFTSAVTWSITISGVLHARQWSAGRLRSFFHSRISLPHPQKRHNKKLQPTAATSLEIGKPSPPTAKASVMRTRTSRIRPSRGQ